MVFNTELFGPPIWTSMHLIAHSYPTNPTHKDKENYKQFFQNLANVLPCIDCQNHFKMTLKKYPLDSDVMKSRESLSKWCYTVHSFVNRNIPGKDYTPPTLRDVKSLYNKELTGQVKYKSDIKFTRL